MRPPCGRACVLSGSRPCRRAWNSRGLRRSSCGGRRTVPGARRRGGSRRLRSCGVHRIPCGDRHSCRGARRRAGDCRHTLCGGRHSRSGVRRRAAVLAVGTVLAGLPAGTAIAAAVLAVRAVLTAGAALAGLPAGTVVGAMFSIVPGSFVARNDLFPWPQYPSFRRVSPFAVLTVIPTAFGVFLVIFHK